MTAVAAAPIASSAPPARDQVDAALRIVAELPQASHIDPMVARGWLEAVAKREPERLRWHALRARGIGGSEMGAVLDAMEGRYHPFTPGDLVARQKLLLSPPDEPSDDTRRGVFMEGPLRDMFRPQMLRQYGARPADDVLERIAEIEVGPQRRNPWQVGNPDDAFWMPDGSLVMADYKAPRPDVLAGYAVFGKPQDYVVQLHHYSMLAQEIGFDPKKLILVSLDYNKWQPAPHEIAFDPTLCARITAAGNRFWSEYVLKGLVPTPVEAPVGVAGDIPEPVLAQIRKIGRMQGIANAAYKKARDAASTLSAVLGREVFLGKPAIAIDHLDVIVKSEVDEPRLATRLQVWGETLDQYRQPKAPNVGRMEARLVQLGEKLVDYYDAGDIDAARVSERLRKGRENPAQYIRETVDVKLTPVRRGERAELLFAVRDQADKVIDAFAQQANPSPEEVAAFTKRSRDEWRRSQQAKNGR